MKEDVMVCTYIDYDAAQALANHTHASHCMIYARHDGRFLKFPQKAAVLVEARYDGCLGFSGGLIDAGESWEDGLNRELHEEINLDLERFHVDRSRHVLSLVDNQKHICFHFYTMEVTLEQFNGIIRSAQESQDYGTEVMGLLTIPLYTMDNGYGFPAFLRNNFVGVSRQQLLFALQHENILTTEQLMTALSASGVQDKTADLKLPFQSGFVNKL